MLFDRLLQDFAIVVISVIPAQRKNPDDIQFAFAS